MKNSTNPGMFFVVPFLLLLCLRSTVFSLSMQFVVTMPSIITNGSIIQFDVFGNGSGSQVFVLIVNNSGDLNTYTNLSLRYRVSYFQSGGGSEKILYEGLSNTFTIAPNEIVPPISSTDFLHKNNPTVKISLKTTVVELSDSDPLKKKFLDTQTLPDGKIRYTMILEGASVPDETSDHTIINTTKVELISPGSSSSGSAAILYDPHPVLIWTSDLPPYIYGNDDVFEVRIYKAQGQESFGEALSRIPVIRAGSKENQYKVPDAGYQFTPGATYYWEVVGFVKGVTTTEIKSSPLAFKMTKPVNPKVQEVIAALKLVYGEDVLEKIYEYDSDVTIKIDGKTVDAGELKATVQQVLSGEYSIQSAVVE